MNIKYKEVKTIPEFIDAIRLRVDVFIKEQDSKPGWEPDELDKNAKHYIAIVNNKAVSTARVRETSKGIFKIERMVTKKTYRKKGIGKGLLKFIINQLNKSRPKKIWLQSQVRSQKFYEKCGFKAVSKHYALWKIPHIDMEYLNLK